MTRRIRPAILAAALIALLSAANSGNEFDVRYMLAALGVATLGVLTKYARDRDRALLRFEERTDGALWGPIDGNGKRETSAGIVFLIHKQAEELPSAVRAAHEAARHARDAARMAQQAAEHAQTAAEAARTAQALLIELGTHNRGTLEDRRHTQAER